MIRLMCSKCRIARGLLRPHRLKRPRIYNLQHSLPLVKKLVSLLNEMPIGLLRLSDWRTLHLIALIQEKTFLYPNALDKRTLEQSAYRQSQASHQRLIQGPRCRAARIQASI